MEDNNLELLESCLARLQKIGAREPLPTQYFFKEAQEIIRGSVDEAYKAGVADGKSGAKKPSVSEYIIK